MTALEHWFERHGERMDGKLVIDVFHAIAKLTECAAELADMSGNRAETRRAMRLAHDSLDAALKSIRTGKLVPVEILAAGKIGETIEKAALRKGRLVLSMDRPARHHTILHDLADLDVREAGMPVNQGFLTSIGRFVDRVEAAVIARRAGQIEKKHGPPDVLFSEDDVW
jgi:hypothetical protein